MDQTSNMTRDFWRLRAAPPTDRLPLVEGAPRLAAAELDALLQNPEEEALRDKCDVEAFNQIHWKSAD